MFYANLLLEAHCIGTVYEKQWRAAVKEQDVLLARIDSNTKQGRKCSARTYMGGAYARQHFPHLVNDEIKPAKTSDVAVKQHGIRRGKAHGTPQPRSVRRGAASKSVSSTLKKKRLSTTKKEEDSLTEDEVTVKKEPKNEFDGSDEDDGDNDDAGDDSFFKDNVLKLQAVTKGSGSKSTSTVPQGETSPQMRKSNSGSPEVQAVSNVEAQDQTSTSELKHLPAQHKSKIEVLAQNSASNVERVSPPDMSKGQTTTAFPVSNFEPSGRQTGLGYGDVAMNMESFDESAASKAEHLKQNIDSNFQDTGEQDMSMDGEDATAVESNVESITEQSAMEAPQLVVNIDAITQTAKSKNEGMEQDAESNNVALTAVVMSKEEESAQAGESKKGSDEQDAKSKDDDPTSMTASKAEPMAETESSNGGGVQTAAMSDDDTTFDPAENKAGKKRQASKEEDEPAAKKGKFY